MKAALALVVMMALGATACGSDEATTASPGSSSVPATATTEPITAAVATLAPTPEPTPRPSATALPSATPMPTAEVTATPPATPAPTPTAPPAPPSPVPTGTTAPGSYPVADLAVTITHPGAPTVSYRILCKTGTAAIEGTVALNATTACTRLDDGSARQRLIAGASPNRICTEIYGGPDLAAMTGTLDGSAVDTVIDRANGCGIDDWDRLLAGVLPSARGVIPPPTATPGARADAVLDVIALAGPTCPVETEPPSADCAPRPVEGALIIVIDRSGSEVGRGTTGSDGSVAMTVPTAILTVIPQPVAGLLGTAPAVSIRLVAGETRSLQVDYDTGIR